MRSSHTAWILLASAFLAGCSSQDLAEVADTADPVAHTLVSTLPVVTEFEKPEIPLAAEDEPIAPFEEDLDFFTPPKMLGPMPLAEPATEGNGKLPPVRLVGFVGATGEQAMVAVGDEMHLVTAGKHLNGVEIVDVKSPRVDLRWGETELTLDFYKPSKAERDQRGKARSGLNAPGLSGANDAPGRRPNTPRPTPSPRPQVSLPALPSLPMPGSSIDTTLPDIPDVGLGMGAATGR